MSKVKGHAVSMDQGFEESRSPYWHQLLGLPPLFSYYQLRREDLEGFGDKSPSPRTGPRWKLMRSVVLPGSGWGFQHGDKVQNGMLWLWLCCVQRTQTQPASVGGFQHVLTKHSALNSSCSNICSIAHPVFLKIAFSSCELETFYFELNLSDSTLVHLH